MTRHQRAQVVELLRCAADDNESEITAMGYPEDITGLAISARWFVSDERCGAYCEPNTRSEIRWRRHDRLEAAQRVEDKEWP